MENKEYQIIDSVECEKRRSGQCDGRCLDRIIEQAYKIGVGQVIDNSDKGAYNSRDSQLNDCRGYRFFFKYII